MSTRADELINEYLDRLEEELADFPSTRRRELVQEISAHIAEARASLENEDEASIRNLLDRMGDPADIAAEAAGTPAAEAPPPQQAKARGSGWDFAALVMLLVGGPLTCTGGNGAGSAAATVLVIALFVVPIAVVAYLARRRSQVAAPA